MRLGAAVLALVCLLGSLASAGGFVDGYCDGGTPVITERPPGSEGATVQCIEGTFLVINEPIALFGDDVLDPRYVKYPESPEEDFAGWVNVRINGAMILPPFDPWADRTEPLAFLVKSSSRVLMPIRFFTEALGGAVEWNPPDRVALRWRDLSVTLVVGQQTALVDGRQVVLDQPPLIHDMRTFVPLRFILETFGATVNWDQSDFTADIVLMGAGCVNPDYCGEPAR